MLTFETLRAIRQGIDSARYGGKLAPQPYHSNHWLFNPWWQAVVAKADFRDWSDSRVIQYVAGKLRRG